MSLSSRDKVTNKLAQGLARSHRVSAPFAVRGSLPARADSILGFSYIVLLILLWCIVSYSKFIPNNFLPTPTLIWNGLVEYHQRGWLLPAFGRSIFRMTQALALAIVIGVPLGVLIGTFAPIDALLRKIINGGKAVPISALGGLAILWFGFDEKGKIFYLFLGTIFFLTILVKNAISSVNEEYVKVALDLGANRWQIIRRVLLPGALPQIWDAITVCIGIMWTYIILAEIINSNEGNMGVGYLLFTANRLGGNSSGKVFGMIIIIALISSLTDFTLQSVRKRYMNW